MVVVRVAGVRWEGAVGGQERDCCSIFKYFAVRLPAEATKDDDGGPPAVVLPWVIEEGMDNAGEERSCCGGAVGLKWDEGTEEESQ